MMEDNAQLNQAFYPWEDSDASPGAVEYDEDHDEYEEYDYNEYHDDDYDYTYTYHCTYHYRRRTVEDDYKAVLQCLPKKHESCLKISSNELLMHVLDNVEEFCLFLCGANHLTRICIGETTRHLFADTLPVYLYNDQLDAWSKLLSCFKKNLPQVQKLTLGFNLTGRLMSALLGSMPTVREVNLFLSATNTLGSQGIPRLVQALSNHTCERLKVTPTFGDSTTGIGHHIGNLNLLPSLDDDKSTHLCLEDQRLDHGICTALAEIMLRDQCPIHELDLKSCSFPDDCADFFVRCVAKAKLTSLHISSMLGNEKFRKALWEHLPLNISLQFLQLTHYGDDDDDKFATILHPLLYDFVSRKNSAMKEIRINSWGSPSLTESQQLELAHVLQDNYSFQSISGIDCGPTVDAILALNRAGRSYILEDASSQQSCIEVLERVNDSVGALHHHLKENPILF